MDTNLIVSPLVGAFIGGFANWLAIHMLFYPIKEVRVFGIRIPFTPGIIPKERKRMAESIAATVSNYFLSKDIIVDAIVSKEAEIYIREYISKLFDKHKNNNKTIEDIIFSYTGKSSNDLIKQYDKEVYKFVIDFIKTEENVNSLSKYMFEIVDENINKPLKQYLTPEQIITLQNSIADAVYSLINSYKTKEFLGQLLVKNLNNISNSDTTLKELLPDELIEDLKAKIIVNSDKITALIMDFIIDSSVQYKLRKKLKESFEDSFKLRMVAKFVDVDKLFEEMFSGFISYLEQPSAKSEIGLYGVKVIENIIDKPINKILSNQEWNENLIVELLQKISVERDTIKYSITSKKLIDIDNLCIKSILDVLNITVDKKEEDIKKIIISILEKDEIERIVKGIITVLIGQVCGQSIAKMANIFDDKKISSIQDVILNKYRDIIKAESNEILDILNISKIVEDKINSFEIEEMENIMLGIIKKDIMVMRIFEAGIGFVIGLIAPLYPYVSSVITNLMK